MKSAYLMRTVKPGRARNTDILTLPAPVNGWSTAGSLVASTPATAQVLENWRPTTTGIALRGGSKTHGTVSAGGDAVISLLSYNAPLNKKLFAATTTEIFDVTTPADANTPPAPDVTGQTAGYYSFTNFTTAGGEFMTAVNGRDPLLLYDATNGWRQITGASSPAITGIDTAKLSFVWVYRNREYFVEVDSLKVWYLPVNSIAGALKDLDLNGVCQRGGAIMFGGTWSIDAGDGIDDKLVIVTDQGEAVVYQGSSPDGDDWMLVGRYDLAPPLGPRATFRPGGDFAICTEAGLIPMSEAINKDRASLDLSAYSREIGPDWRAEAIARRTLPWEIVKWPRMGYAIINCPVASPGQRPISFVLNTQTGAWCKYTGWDTRCMILHNELLYFGTNDGKVKLAEVGGNDDGAGIYYLCVSNPDHVKVPGIIKTIHQARATFRSSTPYVNKLTVSTDYDVIVPTPPESAPDIQSNAWDTGLWDVAVWDGAPGELSVSTKWQSVGRTGYVAQYVLQVTGGLSPAPLTELVSVDYSFELGAAVV